MLLSLKPSPPPTSITFIRSGLGGRVTGHAEAIVSSLRCTRTCVLTSCCQVVNPPTQTGLTSTSSERQPAPGANFVRGKSGYSPFWPGGLDAIITKSDDGGSKRSASEGRGLRTVPPGLKRGLRLSTDQDRESTFSGQYDLDGNETTAESLVVISRYLVHVLDLRTCNSPRCYPTNSRNRVYPAYHPPSPKLITCYQPR